MLTFEDRQRLRALARTVTPHHDLWPGIAARLEQSRAPRRKRFAWLALAASLAGVALLSGAFAVRMMRADQSEHTGTGWPDAQVVASTGNSAQRWHPSDPRLRGAAAELHAAQGELKQALAIAPRSAYLERLLDHTQRQQTRLQHLDVDAS